MTPTPAPTSPGPGWWLLLTALAALAALGYALACWWRPFRRCPRCHGTGLHLRDHGLLTRPCRRCAGTGRRLRLGRRVHNHLTRLRGQAARTR